MSEIQDYVLMGTAWSTMLVSIAVLAALVYLYVTARLRGTLFLLIWKSPVMALGSYLYLRSGWRWPKSLLLWAPFGVAGVLGQHYLLARWFIYMGGPGLTIWRFSAGSSAVFAAYVKAFVTSVLLLLAVIFLIQDLIRLTRQRRHLGDELPVASGGLQ